MDEELREKIAKILRERLGTSDEYSEWAYDAADTILALMEPDTRLRVQEKCPHYALTHVHDCIGGCFGSGFITRKPTLAELVEIAEFLTADWFLTHHVDFLTLPAGQVTLEDERDK